MEQLKYPIGKFDSNRTDYPLEELLEYVLQIQYLPNELSKFLNLINAENAENSYRPGGWNIRQIIHHLADAHMNAWIRTKLMLSEENPTIKPWDENLWAAERDYGYAFEASYIILVGVHQRWSLLLLDSLKTPEKLHRTFFHPELNKSVSLAQLIAMYAWHGNTHLAHIRLVLGM
jgi:hypothetical protein